DLQSDLQRAFYGGARRRREDEREADSCVEGADAVDEFVVHRISGAQEEGEPEHSLLLGIYAAVTRGEAGWLRGGGFSLCGGGEIRGVLGIRVEPVGHGGRSCVGGGGWRAHYGIERGALCLGRADDFGHERVDS